MASQLNLKNDEARSLAERIAKATGETITDAVTKALRARLREVERVEARQDNAKQQRERDFYRLIDGSRGRWRGAQLSVDYKDILYDEHGLPR